LTTFLKLLFYWYISMWGAQSTGALKQLSDQRTIERSPTHG
jgi:hypothetical protein